MAWKYGAGVPWGKGKYPGGAGAPWGAGCSGGFPGTRLPAAGPCAGAWACCGARPGCAISGHDTGRKMVKVLGADSGRSGGGQTHARPPV